ncbi:MAG: 50S ribosomal protein L3, partial [bacterium]
VEAGPCVVTQIPTHERDGYAAEQLGFGEIPEKRLTKPQKGHFAKAGVRPSRHIVEIRTDDASSYEVGSSLTVETFTAGEFVDVIGVSKGKGFAGAMKRHNFAGLRDTHGTERKHRSPGSIAGHATNRGTGPKPKKGKKMSGQMGNERVTVRNLDVIEIQPEKNILLIKGAVPGPNGGLLLVRTSVRLGRSKQLQVSGKKKN